MDRLQFFRNGWLIDEVVASTAAVLLRRAGKARYDIRIESTSFALDLALWTTQRGSLQVNLYDGPAPSWLDVRFVQNEVESIQLCSGGVHFEHLDRNYYYLGLWCGQDRWMLNFAGAGYPKLAPRTLEPAQFCERT